MTNQSWVKETRDKPRAGKKTASQRVSKTTNRGRTAWTILHVWSDASHAPYRFKGRRGVSGEVFFFPHAALLETVAVISKNSSFKKDVYHAASLRKTKTTNTQPNPKQRQTTQQAEREALLEGRRDESETVKGCANSLSLSYGLVQKIVAPIAKAKASTL